MSRHEESPKWTEKPYAKIYKLEISSCCNKYDINLEVT